jgi:hypothetical protein
MRWSKLKSLTEQRFAEALAGRVAIWSTRYGNCRCGRAWLTVDGGIVASFCTRAAQAARSSGIVPLGGPLGHGELSRQDAYAACWAFVHDLTIDQALADGDPLVQTLARTLLRVRLEAEERMEPKATLP